MTYFMTFKEYLDRRIVELMETIHQEKEELSELKKKLNVFRGKKYYKNLLEHQKKIFNLEKVIASNLENIYYYRALKNVIGDNGITRRICNIARLFDTVLEAYLNKVIDIEGVSRIIGSACAFNYSVGFNKYFPHFLTELANYYNVDGSFKINEDALRLRSLYNMLCNNSTSIANDIYLLYVDFLEISKMKMPEMSTDDAKILYDSNQLKAILDDLVSFMDNIEKSQIDDMQKSYIYTLIEGNLIENSETDSKSNIIYLKNHLGCDYFTDDLVILGVMYEGNIVRLLTIIKNKQEEYFRRLSFDNLDVSDIYAVEDDVIAILLCKLNSNIYLILGVAKKNNNYEDIVQRYYAIMRGSYVKKFIKN